jgi:flagella basal body P-ring formation protein FlgA
MALTILDRRRWIVSHPITARLALGLAACTAAIPAHAQPANEDWQTIDVLTDMVAKAMGRTATPVDRRIKLARCPEQASVTAIDANALAVRCASLGWRLRVPMTGPTGAAPAAASYSRPAASAPVIRRGDNVRVTIDTESFSISYAAVAAEDGRVGETIALRGNDAKSSLSATVIGPGRARLDD